MARISERRVDKDPGWIERRFREVEEKIAGKLGANTPIPGGVTTITQILTDPAVGVGFIDTDAVTAGTSEATVILPLSRLPIPGSLHIRQNGLDLAESEWTWTDYTVTIPPSSGVVIRSGDVFDAAYAYNTLTAPGPAANEYVAAVLADAPILYATLADQSTTTVADSSGNARHGTYGGPVTLGAETLAPGLPGTSVDFTDGGWAEFAPGEAWQRTAPFTVELWYQLDNQHVTEAAVLAACDDFGSTDTDRVWGLAVPSSGATHSVDAFVISGTSSAIAAETTEIVIGQTYYVVMDFDGSDVRLFIDGVFVDSATAVGAINTSTLWPLTLGKTADGQLGRYGETYGRLQHFALYDKVLSDARRTAHYTIGVGG